MKIKEWFFELLGTLAVVLLAPREWRDTYRDRPATDHNEPTRSAELDAA